MDEQINQKSKPNQYNPRGVTITCHQYNSG